MKYYKNKKIIFRFDIGNFDGFGHYKRSSALIEFLIKKNLVLQFVLIVSQLNF